MALKNIGKKPQENVNAKREKISAEVRERSEIESVPEDVYAAEVSGAEKVDMPFGETVRLRFRILDKGDAEDKEVTGLAKLSLSPATKLFKWLTALGVPLEAGSTIPDIEGEVLGRKCRIVVKNKTREVEGGEEVTFSNVAEVLAAK